MRAPFPACPAPQLCLLGQIAIRHGLDVRFAITTTLQQLAETRDKGRSEWVRRMDGLVKPAIVVLDAFATRDYSSISAKPATRGTSRAA